MSRSFINLLKKDVLSDCLRELGVDNEGSVDEMRVRLRAHLDKKDIPPDHELYIQKIRAAYEGSKELKVTGQQSSRVSSPARSLYEHAVDTVNISEICDKVRKWGVKYDGGKEPLCFLERIEELAMCYSIPKNSLLSCMPELLKGEALAWYRNNKVNWEEYTDFLEDFKLFFLPNQFFENLDDSIRNRSQKNSESFVSYVTELQSLMRWTNFTLSQQLDRIYKNCRAEYKIYIKRSEFTKLRELIRLAQEYENIRAEENRQLKPVRNVQAVVAVGHSKFVCYRCGEKGHSRAVCNKPQILFCWDCGKRGVKTVDCCRYNTENSNRDPCVEGRAEDL